jgi:hypothetical protein
MISWLFTLAHGPSNDQKVKGVNHKDSYAVRTSPNVVEYIGWIGLSPSVNYHNLSMG